MMPKANFKADPLRVGMLLKRDRPPRLVERFGYIMPDRTARLDPDRYGSVLWDDGELDLVEWERLLPISQMDNNPDGFPVISYEDEIGSGATGTSFGRDNGRLDRQNSTTAATDRAAARSPEEQTASLPIGNRA